MEIPYELLGKLFVYMLLFALLGIVVALLVGFYSFKNKMVIFPSFVLFMLYLFYSPAKWMCGVFSIRDTLVDEILIEIRNAVMLDDFINAKGPRAVFLPQCMRHPNCRARCDPILGYECKKCGLCDIGIICKAADEHGFTVYVIPGGSFVKKIMKAHKPGSCIGVACYNELSESMEEISFMPVQGVCLLKDGCFNTKVDVLEVIEKMELCNV
ncbi:DUF116 domain-containing protein [Methanococcoides burtonii]|uniref:Polyprenyl synthetase n=1 Tax=Methanococcoides burtonii (strain DSM 6242 / NBRC 107633 / OCM 468 / ACE-M) TaxID=259564 RepID=Q12TD7_METBU|nr:DUF116 domain-containing protein [Methanococcoides burtonii]ABE53289.1 Protein of unknown function DUF116 [Methanococcoides burtonii DSM 6242]